MSQSGGAGVHRRERSASARRLLVGEEIDRSEHGYGSGGHHLAVLATGAQAPDLLRRLAEHLDRDLILGEHGEATAVWLGSARPFEEAEMEEIAAAATRHEGLLAVGEPGEGLGGRRATRRQAEVSYGFAKHRRAHFSRYGDVALLAAVASDPDLAEFLEQRFLTPISDPGSDRALPKTLRAYLDAGGDIPTTAAALGVGRQSVVERIDLVEELIGRAPAGCLAELDLALRLRTISAYEGEADPASHQRPPRASR